MSVMELWRTGSLEEAAAYAREADPRALCDTIDGLADSHEASFDRHLDLVGSHGLMSPRARAMLGTGLIDKMRQAGHPGGRVHAGGEWIDRVEVMAAELAKRLFGVRYAELRPLSCALANGIVFGALARRGDKILAQTRFHGADPSTTPQTFGRLFGHEYVELPYDEARLTADAERAAEAIRSERPRLVVVGSGYILFPYPVGALKEAAASVGAAVFYDGAHAMGLAAGGQYQDPIAEGADVVTGSTPKTFCGPTGGIIVTNDSEIAHATTTLTSQLLSSYPNNHMAALAVTLAEMLAFWKDYARDVVANAQALARALDEQGVPVLARELGYTRSHLILFEPGRRDAVEAVKRLERAGLFATPIRLPPGSPLKGVRMGTASVTRRGMGVDEMTAIAAFIRRVVLDGEDPEAVGRDVSALARAFTTVHYCFP